MDLNWEALNLPTTDLRFLEGAFTETEVLNALGHLPGDKALGPEGFPSDFYIST